MKPRHCCDGACQQGRTCPRRVERAHRVCDATLLVCLVALVFLWVAFPGI